MSNRNVEQYVFSDEKLIPIQTEVAKSQISNNNNNNNNNNNDNNNNNMLFDLPAASFQVQSNNDEKQKSNKNTMDQVQQQQSVQYLMNIVEQ